MKILPPLLSVALLGSLALPAQAWERVYNFDHDRVDMPPEGFIIEAAPKGYPTAVVATNEEAPSKPNVLTLIGADWMRNNSLVCIANRSFTENGSITVRALRTPAQKDKVCSLGMAFRYQPGKAMGLFEWDTRKNRAIISSSVLGKSEILTKVEAPAPSATWVTLKVSFKGPEIKCSIDGKEVVSISNFPVIDGGDVGLYIESESPIHFDDFRIESSD